MCGFRRLLVGRILQDFAALQWCHMSAMAFKFADCDCKRTTRTRKTLKFYVAGHLQGNSRKTYIAENVSMLWRHNVSKCLKRILLIASPGYQQSWYWLCRIGKFLSCKGQDLHYLCHVNVEEWFKMWIYVLYPLKNFARKGLINITCCSTPVASFTSMVQLQSQHG